MELFELTPHVLDGSDQCLQVSFTENIEFCYILYSYFDKFNESTHLCVCCIIPSLLIHHTVIISSFPWLRLCIIMACMTERTAQYMPIPV